MLAIGDGLRGWNGVVIDGLAIAGRISRTDDNRGSTARARKRHQGKAIFAFCDAHVEDLTLHALFSDTNAAALALWNRDGQPHGERLR
jgi:prepilin-type processing-associated H-X9-DG protein